jgi:hypothetical protein
VTQHGLALNEDHTRMSRVVEVLMRTVAPVLTMLRAAALAPGSAAERCSWTRRSPSPQVTDLRASRSGPNPWTHVRTVFEPATSALRGGDRVDIAALDRVSQIHLGPCAMSHRATASARRWLNSCGFGWRLSAVYPSMASRAALVAPRRQVFNDRSIDSQSTVDESAAPMGPRPTLELLDGGWTAGGSHAAPSYRTPERPVVAGSKAGAALCWVEEWE